MTEMEKINREDLLDDIWSICKEFKVVFPKDLPKCYEVWDPTMPTLLITEPVVPT